MGTLSRNQQCQSCGRYENRGISVDAIIIKDNKILLIKRGSEPDKGLWAVPGGYVGWDESAEDAVLREVKEETNLDVINTKLINVYSLPNRHPKQVINVAYIVDVKNGELKHGDDATNIKWVSLDNLPNPLALDHKQIIQDAIKRSIKI